MSRPTLYCRKMLTNIMKCRHRGKHIVASVGLTTVVRVVCRLLVISTESKNNAEKVIRIQSQYLSTIVESESKASQARNIAKSKSVSSATRSGRHIM